MPSDSSFTRLPDTPAGSLTIDVEGESVPACEGETLAAALLAGGHLAFRMTPVSGVLRGPFCMMGVCFDCLVEIDGVPNQQACQVLVRDGMKIRGMRGARTKPEAGAHD